ncbi:MAG: hypothetical protein RLZZ179_3035 [Verrucomicrobiota bacterium]
MPIHSGNLSAFKHPMITVDSLTEAADSGNVVFHEFMHYYRPDRPIVYGLVEGRDDPAFYRGAIEPLLPEGWIIKLIPVGTKKKVLEAFQLKEWQRYPEGCVCFYVDRDFSEIIPEPHPNGVNLYVSDHYSIECEIVNYRVAERTLEEIMGVTKLTPDESDKLRVLFESNLLVFREAIVPLMAQVVIWRREGLRPHLKNFDPSVFFSYVDGAIVVKPEYATRNSRLSAAASKLGMSVATDAALDAVEAEFRAAEKGRCFTRGKYLLKFLLDFLSSVHSSISKFCAKHTTPPRVSVTLGRDNAMAEMALRAKCPRSLRSFVESNYIAHIGNKVANA